MIVPPNRIEPDRGHIWCPYCDRFHATRDIGWAAIALCHETRDEPEAPTSEQLREAAPEVTCAVAAFQPSCDMISCHQPAVVRIIATGRFHMVSADACQGHAFDTRNALAAAMHATHEHEFNLTTQDVAS